MTRLALPHERHYPSWVETLHEFGDEPINGSGLWHWTGSKEHRDLATYGLFIADLKRWGDRAVAVEPGKVHSDYYWITDGVPDTLVGFLALRHALTPALVEVGGHIGFSVRPSRRRQGHATRALGLALPYAAELGIARVLVTCDDGNIGSQRAIEANGGMLDDIRNGKRRYWIVTR
jgi:predicted acetyltransferase